MKTMFIAIAALAFLAGSAHAATEHCVTRTVTTNYNDGLNGGETTVCYSDSKEKVAERKKAEPPTPPSCDPKTAKSS